MKNNLLFLCAISLITFFASGCKKDEPIKGNLKIRVIGTNAQGIKNAEVHLSPSDMTGFSDNLGDILFQSLDISQLYSVDVTKEDYEPFTKYGIQLKGNQTSNLTVNLAGIPDLMLSDSVFDFDSTKTQIPFFITNAGQGNLTWQLQVGSLFWISAIPGSGETTTESDLVYLTVNRTQLPPGVYNENVFLTSNGGLVSLKIKTIVSKNSPPQNTVTDIDGNTYNIIQIGNQYWMKENLRVTHNPFGGDIESYYYESNPAYLQIYGRLYTWDAAMNNSLQERAQGLCPNGWHIPTSGEWQVLFNYLGDIDVAGGKLKETGTEHWQAPNEGATNSSGFTAVPGGDYWYDGTYHYLQQRAFFWTSTSYSSTESYSIYLHYLNSEVVFFPVLNTDGFSVRCLKD